LKVLTIVGARPQFVKAAVVSRALRARDSVREILVHTGQHYDPLMSDVFFEELNIPAPDYNLLVGSGSHGAQTGRMLEAMERVLLDERPDWVLVFGDTNSTLAGALAAVKLHLRLAHVESGLRSHNRKQPEEINRVCTDHVADLLFVPTLGAAYNLQKEGVAASRICLVGDVMYDAALYYGSRAESRSPIWQRLGLRDKEFVLATVHRAENTDDGTALRAILGALDRLAQELPVVLPLHPRARKVLQQSGLFERFSRHIRILDPVGYLDMVALEKHARLIATDSGGIQKEAFFYGVPCVTLRAETEWTELVEAGANRLAPPTSMAAVEAVLRAALAAGGAAPEQLYGDGNSGAKIADALVSAFAAEASPPALASAVVRSPARVIPAAPAGGEQLPAV
jgi:UDP-GlcNAc3NAcA epimerase